MKMNYDPSNDCGIRVPVFDLEKLGLYMAKLRAVVAMKGLDKALDMKSKTKLPAKEDHV